MTGETLLSILIKGQTFMYRREIKALNGKWNPELNGWIVPAGEGPKVDQIAARAKANGDDWTLSYVEVPAETYRRLEGEELRAARQAGADRKATQLLERALKKAGRGKALLAEAERISDMIPPGQPILVGHHSERRHRRDLERIRTKTYKGFELINEGLKLQKRAEGLQSGVRVKGDAEREDQAHRDAITAAVTVGMTVHCPIYGDLEVLKVNQKTLKVRGRFGDLSVDKALFTLPKSAPEASA